MFCIVAFIVLSILGIFSATNRQLAREALDCVFRRVTLRPCNTGFDEKVKAKILGSVIMRSESAARFLNRYFEALSWVFFILLLASTVLSIRGVYLYYVTGSCNGLNQQQFCVFDPKGEHNQVSSVSETCSETPITAADVTLEGVKLDGFPALNQGTNDAIVFIGCYDCDYTRESYPLVKKLVDEFGVSFTFLHYPVKEPTDYLSRLGYCVYQQNESAYWDMNDVFFSTDKSNLTDETFLQDTIEGLGLDINMVDTCVSSPITKDIVKRQMDEIVKTHFYGTPTVFINGDVLVGPKPYRVYAIMLRGLWYW